MQHIFITGTDTGVGKTVLAAALLTALRARGVEAVPLKPVQTGCSEGPDGRDASDLAFCLRAAGLQAGHDRVNRLCPVRLIEPCSPHLAAERENTVVDTDQLVSRCLDVLAEFELVLVEGAGGLMVPIHRTYTMLNLMQELALPVLLAARPALGTLNHTLLSLQALRGAGLKVMGVAVVASSPEPPGFIEQDNLHTLAELGGVPVYGPLPYLPGLDSLENSGPALCQAAEEGLGELLDRLAGPATGNGCPLRL